jgi:dUTP pyrophosphatase
MKVRIKKLHKDAVIPTYAKKGDAGMDLTAVDYYYDLDGNVVYLTGLAIEIPDGYVGLIFPRSSVCKHDINLTNAVGVIDSGYRGEITMKFKPSLCFQPNENTNYLADDKFDDCDGVFIPFDKKIPIEPHIYNHGERIGQIIIMPYPQIEFEEVEELSNTERGLNGYGSSGR